MRCIKRSKPIADMLPFIFLLGIISCMPEDYSENEIEPNSNTQIEIEKYKELYGAREIEIRHLKAKGSLNALIINLVDADRLPSIVDEREEISHQIASSMLRTMSEELTKEVATVDFGFKTVLRKFLTYEKSSIDYYRFDHTNGELIPTFP